MQIVRDLAGYSWGRSDLVRRAMSKKKADVMAKERNSFIYGNPDEGVAGCVANGVPENVAVEIFDEMTDFASYAFNKSHAVCYAVVSYQTAYLKAYYPREFMAALMTSVMSTQNKVPAYINSCRQMGIEVVPPDINSSYGEFGVKDEKISFGMNAIKSLGAPTIEALVKEREENGSFRSLNDFIRRLMSHLTRANLEALIKAGALDCFGKTRRSLMMVAGDMLENEKKSSKAALSGQMSITDLLSGSAELEGVEIEVPEASEYDRKDILEYEKEVLGVYVSGHPLNDVERLLQAKTDKRTSDFTNDDGAEPDVRDGEVYTVGGIIMTSKTITTRKNELMAFVTIEDMEGSLEIVVFPGVYAKSRSLTEVGSRVLVKGKTNIEANGEAKFLAESFCGLDEVPCRIWIRLPDEDTYKNVKKELGRILDDNEGSGFKQSGFVIYCEKEKSKDDFGGRKAALSNTLLETLEKKFGKKNVAIT